MKQKRSFIFSLVMVACFPVLVAQTVKQAKDTIDDKSIVAPQSMTEDLSKLLHDWQMDFKTTVKGNCSQGQNVFFNDSIYIRKLHRIPSEMELSYNRVVRSYIDMYSGRRRSQVAYMLALGDYYFPMFEQMLDKEGLPLELKYLPVIESALNPVAVSRVGATGLWQFMLRTGKGYGLEVNSLVDERRDPYKSTEAAVRYLKDLYSIYQDWNLVIAAYNCGPGNVNKAIARSGGKRDYWEIYYFLPRETRGYVPAFIAANYIMNYYADHNICPMQMTNYSALDTVHVRKEIHLAQISNVLDIPLMDIKRLNPQFTRDIIPGNYEPYTLVLPTEKVTAFVDKEGAIFDYNRSQFLTHRLETDQYIREESYAGGGTTNVYYRVRRGDNLSKIAAKHGVTVAQLKSWNRLRVTKIPVGKRIIVRKNVVNTEPKSSSSGQPQYAQAVSGTSEETVTKTVNQYYRVKKGDTLGGIARKNRVTVSQLQSWNGLRSNNISIGKNLIVSKKKVMVANEAPAKKEVTYNKAETPASSEGSSVISNYLKAQIKASEDNAENELKNHPDTAEQK